MLKDLLSSYNQQIDIQCITGSGTSPAMKGLANIGGINAVTYTSASPTAALLYSALGQAASAVARQRFQMPSAIVMTPQRWFWLVTQVDSSGRPLVLPRGAQGFNAMGTFDEAAEGLVGEIFGIPIYVDANIPSNVGTGTNQDTVYVAKFDDLYLFEGAMRTRVLVETLSGTLQVRVQLYNYVAGLVDRFPVSVSAINGTGLISPAGF
jgi:HK97 family phage major capsid protein